jgi:hypothetical protein
MNSQFPRSPLSRVMSLPLHSPALAAVAILMPATFAQPIEPNTIPVKNWPVPKWSNQSASAAASSSGLVFIPITPCRLMDTRVVGGSGKTGKFGPPSLIGGQARIVPVPSSNCGVPVAAAYSMNLVSVTPLGQAVAWISAWPDNNPTWPGTVILNAVQGGRVDNSAIVQAGPDGGIQVLATDNCDLVIDMNGYFVPAATMVGPAGPPGPTGNTGATGSTGPRGAPGPAGTSGAIAFADFFALMPSDNAGTVPVGSDVLFPQDGPTSNSTITRLSPSQFVLSAVGTYQVMFQASVTEPGQLDLSVNAVELLYTVVGRATGTTQITGVSLVTTTLPNSLLTVRNPGSNSTALTLTPIAGGASPVSAHLVITQVQ